MNEENFPKDLQSAIGMMIETWVQLHPKTTVMETLRALKFHRHRLTEALIKARMTK